MPRASPQSAEAHESHLLQRVAEGDRPAFEELYTAYHRRLSRFLMRLAPRYDFAEEIINDTFWVVWRKAGEFRGASRVSTWIMGIAYRRALRAPARRAPDCRARPAACPEESSPDSEDSAAAADMQDWISQGLAELPEEQRLTLELAYFLGLSCEEIAAVTGSPGGHDQGPHVPRPRETSPFPSLTRWPGATESLMNHKHAWDLIPWYVNGTVSDSKRDGLVFHLEQCSQCRDEVETQRALMQGMKTAPAGGKHAARLAAETDAAHRCRSRAAAPGRSRAPARTLRWLTAAVVLQALMLGVLATLLLRSPRGEVPALYQTVSSPAPAADAASVRAVFSPDMTLGELQALLERAHLRIVNGPSPDGVYTLATSSVGDDPRQALLTLRAHPAARFAEPIGR